jgi:hypothetical protein|tara:strand:+ start:356 stop:697 length:342 start_codon:yes stop_codon:yes gene_type:complete
MTEKGNVFVIQEVSKFNVIPAQEYGTLVPVFEEGKQIMLSPAPAIRKLKQVLKNFNDKDYLLLIGDPSIIGVACSIASDINQGKYKMLKYDRRSYTYYPIQVDLYERSMKHDG